MADLPVSKRQYVVLVNPAGEVYQAGDGMNSSVTITGDALTAMQASATSLAAIATAIGDAADAAGDPTVIGLLKQIAENTTPAP